MTNKPLLFTIVAIIGLISLAISSTIPASAPGEEMGVIDDGQAMHLLTQQWKPLPPRRLQWMNNC